MFQKRLDNWLKNAINQLAGVVRWAEQPSVFLFTILFICLLFYPWSSLEIRTKDGDLLAYYFVQLGDTFDIQWTHSVTLQPVIETYKIEDYKKISLEKLVFNDFGPNLPAHPWTNEKFDFKDGHYIITNFDLYFTKVPVSIGAMLAKHNLIYKNKVIILEDIYKPGGFIYIEVTKNNFVQLITKEVGIWQKKQTWCNPRSF